MRDKLLPYFVAALACLSARGDEVPLTIKDWSLGRARQTSEGFTVMEAGFRLQNGSDKPATDAQLVMTFKNSVGETLKESKLAVIAKIAPREAVSVKLATPFVPTFDYYEIVANFKLGDKPARAVWQAQKNDPRPELRIDRLVPDVADVKILGYRITPAEKDKLALGKVRLKNYGALAATDLVLTAVFLPSDDPTSKPVAQWNGGVGDGRLAPGEEKAFQFVPTTAPKNYARTTLRVDFHIGTKEQEPEPPPAPASPEKTTLPPAPPKSPPPLPKLAAGEFTREQAVETAGWEFARPDDAPRDLIVRGKVRNGLRDTVRNVRVTLSLNKLNLTGEPTVVRKEEIRIAEPLVAGEIRAFEARLTNVVEEFSGYQVTIESDRVK